MPSSKRRILCAETHQDTCALITQLLEQQGHEVKLAESAVEFLELATKEHFDLYMLDDDYADGTSLELCRKLRKLTPETPILFFTAAAFPNDREAAMEAGAQMYLTKPIDILEIAEAVNSILLGRQKTVENNKSHGQ